MLASVGFVVVRWVVFPTAIDSVVDPNVETSRNNNRWAANIDNLLATTCISYVANDGTCPK